MAAAGVVTHPHPGHYDVIVIGAGMIGSMVARELSKFEGRIGFD